MAGQPRVVVPVAARARGLRPSGQPLPAAAESGGNGARRRRGGCWKSAASRARWSSCATTASARRSTSSRAGRANGVSMPWTAHFDNPLIAGHYWGASGGSRGTSRRVAVDLRRLEQEAAYQALFREGFALAGRPFGIWRVIPPSRAGLNNYVYQVKCGRHRRQVVQPLPGGRVTGRTSVCDLHGLHTAGGRRVSAAPGGPSCARPDEPAASPAGSRRAGARGARGARRPGRARRSRLPRRPAEGLDISGTFFRFGGEP